MYLVREGTCLPVFSNFGRLVLSAGNFEFLFPFPLHFFFICENWARENFFNLVPRRRRIEGSYFKFREIWREVIREGKVRRIYFGRLG